MTGEDDDVYGGDRSPVTQTTASIRVPVRRRRLGGVVIGAIAGCALILVAAVIARASHGKGPRSDTSDREAAGSGVPSAPLAHAGLRATPVSATVAPPAPVAEAPVTGTVRVQRPAIPGHVWLDGKKLSSSSALVGCGAHQIKLSARGRTRTVEVPCGGEIVISK